MNNSLRQFLFKFAILLFVPLVVVAAAYAQLATLDSEESAFLTLINNFRAQNGAGALQISAALENSSTWMANDMAAKNYFSHTDSLGRQPGTRFATFGYTYYPWGENIAAGNGNAQNTFNQWVTACDPDAYGNCTYAHRANMLYAGYKAIGIGRAYNANSTYGWYWVNDFGGVVDQVLAWTVTSLASGPSGSGTISPATQTVNNGATTTFTVTPASGYTASMGGTCPLGSPSTGSATFTYTTGAITAPCLVTATFSAAQCTLPPGQATLSSPSGTVTTPTPTYTWNAVPCSSWYYLWVNDSTGTRVQQVYTAAQAGCASGTGTCSITPTTALNAGSGQWWVQTHDAAGDGPWSTAMNFTVSGGGTCSTAPGQATLTSPSGTVTTTTPTYTWNAVPCSSWYCLWVNDSTGTRVQQWYTAAQASCASGTGTCSITPTTAVANGSGQWWIQTWDTAGYGPWSSTMNFTVNGGSCTTIPGQATLSSPSGTVTTTTPTYTWNAVPCSSWYYLWVNDSTGTRVQQWYTAAQASCASGTGTCSVTPPLSLAHGSGQWWIQTWDDAGYGPWSSAKNFSVSP